MWSGGTANKGYGSFWDGTKKVGAHQFSLDIHFHRNSDQWVLHRCDNPPCVNPSHLFLGNNQINVDDMWSKERGYSFFKEPHSRDSSGHAISSKKPKET